MLSGQPFFCLTSPLLSAPPNLSNVAVDFASYSNDVHGVQKSLMYCGLLVTHPRVGVDNDGYISISFGSKESISV